MEPLPVTKSVILQAHQMNPMKSSIIWLIRWKNRKIFEIKFQQRFHIGCLLLIEKFKKIYSTFWPTQRFCLDFRAEKNRELASLADQADEKREKSLRLNLAAQ